jgi:hypothetical protein
MDNWQHRSVNMQCRTCMWYVPKVVESETVVLGRCRRRCPTLGGWPAVFEHDWCGDHKLNEKHTTPS